MTEKSGVGHSVCRPDGRVLAGGFKTREAAVSAAVELIYGLKQPSDFEDAEAPEAAYRAAVADTPSREQSGA